MKKAIIVSDTHGKDEMLEQTLDKELPVDMLIHCGDVEGREFFIEAIAECPCCIIAGNNDFFSSLPREEEIQIGPYRALLTHGHWYGVSVGPERLLEEAEYRGVQIAMFGHTHKPFLEEEHGITLLNPGSLSYPRQDGRRPSYITVDVDRFGEWHYTINYLNRGRPRFW